MAAQPQPRLTAQQYLEIERAAETRSEFYRGEMFAMAGASRKHGLIVTNLARELSTALKSGPCEVITQDLRTCVAPDGLYTYPDVVIVCDKPKFADNNTDTLLNPTVLIEVLSPSTEAHDRGFKAAQYRTMPSVQEYAFVSQEEARVEVYRRHGNGWLLTESIGLDAVCAFSSLDCRIALSEIYDKVEFEAGPEPPMSQPA